MILMVFEAVRIILVCIAFYWGYKTGFADNYDSVAQLHIMIPVIIVAIAGISVIEGIFFAIRAAEFKGFEIRSNY